MRLLCEGDNGSVDIRILAEILRDLPVELRASRSRSVLEREANGRSVAAIRDGDFPAALELWIPDPTPQSWVVGGIWRGWMWRRKEIENYILDPEVLARSFGWWPGSSKAEGYTALLQELLQATAERTAARIALVGLLPRYERRVVKPFEPSLSGDALVLELRERHRRAEGRARIDEEALVAHFLTLRPLCMQGGPGFHPWVVAGKDLMGAMSRLRGVRERFPELVVPGQLTAAVHAAMRADPEPASWLPEWAGLRREVEAWILR